MKKLFILLLSAGLLFACNNNPFAPKNQNADNRDKDDKKERTDKDRNNNGYDDNDDYANKERDRNNTRGNWSNSQRDELRSRCMNEFRDEDNARQICSCLLDKVEQRYPDYDDAMRHDNERDIENIAEDCEERFKENDYNNGNDNGSSEYVTRDRNNGATDGGYNNTAWTDLQRQVFIQGCATEARKFQGYTEQQINTYCDCMTRKIEKKYTFDQANKLKAADYQTQEMASAVADCKSRMY